MKKPTEEQWSAWYKRTSNREREIARIEYEEETRERQCDNEEYQPPRTEEEEEFYRKAVLGINDLKTYE